MKMTKAFVLSGMALVSVAMAAQESVTLRRKLEANTTDTYKITSTIKQTVTMPNGMGEQDMNMSTVSTYAIKILKVDPEKDVAEIESKTTMDKFSMEGPGPGEIPTPDERQIVMKGKMDSLGTMSLEVPKMEGGLGMLMGAGQAESHATMFVSFPKQAVKIGDTWSILVPKGMFTDKDDQTLTAKLVGEKQDHGKDVWIVSINGTMKSKFDTSALGAEKNPRGTNVSTGMAMTIKARTEVSAEGLVDKATGKTVAMTTKGKTKTTIEMKDMGMSLDTSGTISTVLTLQ